MGDTWLQLPPEMGGTRFGPFRGGIVQIGTDNAQCQIVLQANTGIAPVHVTVAVQGPGSYLVQPIQRGFGLFLVRAGGGMSPVAAAVQASAGDTLVVGTPAGPRFTLSYEETATQATAPRGQKARGGASGFAGKMGQEMMRQQKARWLMRNPLYREYYRLSHRYRSGALTNPRVLAGLLLGGAGALFALGTACLGGVTVLLRSIFG
jgi:hypothetical protein